ncbi:MAG: phosphoketolase family protein [Phycisphaerae bacterium]
MSTILQDRVDQLNTYWRAANYLGAAQVYLKQNALLRQPLKAEDIKPRLLGHWGTVPGLNLIYAHLNRLIQDTGADILFVAGPGHGAPANLANLYLEGTLGHYYPEMTYDLEGLNRLVRQFSWPGGMPSHNTALTPGTIHEGGELGYSLSHSYGAALDNPDLIVACVVGDGEAETGPMAASWHSNKFLNPATDGAVLPILHVNGYKISSATIFARMSDEELRNLFSGYGYQVRFVEGHDPQAVHPVMWEALDGCYGEIRRIQQEARGGKPVAQPVWPMIILRTPKGWTCPKSLDGVPLEGTCHCHQIPVPNPAKNPEHLKALNEWLTSYHPETLFDETGRPKPQVTAICPVKDKRMGMNPHGNGGQLLVALNFPDYTQYAVAVPNPGAVDAESTRELGKFLRDLIKKNESQKNFRIVCPDEMSSNRLDAVFEATSRVFEWPIIPTDEHLSTSGRVMEILSEHTCEGWLEGYILTGRHGLFPCYEAFSTIVDSMVSQHAKWLKMSHEVPWRKPIASLNYLLTSHAWRQDHNGYSHQGPGFINTLLTKKSSVVRIYLPPDANCLLSVADHCLRSQQYVNLIIASKQMAPQWLDMKTAQQHCAKGGSVWEWASNDGENPDVVLAGIGDIPTWEVLAAVCLLRQEVPDLRVRVVNIVDLFVLESQRDHPHGMEEKDFVNLFTENAPVIVAFHGYPRVIHELLYHRPNPSRFHVRGYIEEGTTTTPFDMTVLNKISRYHLAGEALRRVPRIRSQVADIIDRFEQKLTAHRKYIQENGRDLPEIENWRWTTKELLKILV